MAATASHTAWREAVLGHRTGNLVAMAQTDHTVVESIVDEVR